MNDIAIFSILKSKNVPLTCTEISIFLNSGEEVIYDYLVDNILLKGEQSLFFKTASNQFGLREWLKTEKYFEVYPTSATKISPLDEIISVFSIEKISNFNIKDKFKSINFSEYSFKSLIMPMKRVIAEKDKTMVQLVSCFIICDSNDNIITFYKTNYQPEKRLNYNKKCINFGGHILYEEFFTLFDCLDTSSDFPFVLRELFEEINVGNNQLIKVSQLGLLYDDSTEIGRQHLGLVYKVLLKDIEIITTKEKKLFSKLSVESIGALKLDYKLLDSWSENILRNLK